MRSLWVVAIFAILTAGCMSSTSSNSNQPLTNSSGGTSSGGTTSGSGGSGIPAPQPNAAGLVSGFDPNNSLVRGYAYDATEPNTSFMVELWLDNPRPTGIALGQVLANVNRFLFPTGPHGFTFTMPMQYQDGKLRLIYVYAIDGAARNELGGSPMAFWAGVNLTGKQYWDQTVAPSINGGGGCMSCHDLGGNPADYIYAKSLMMSPNKFTTGSATNNELINRALGINHGGGNRCGGANNGICSLFQQWWAKEFN